MHSQAPQTELSRRERQIMNIVHRLGRVTAAERRRTRASAEAMMRISVALTAVAPSSATAVGAIDAVVKEVSDVCMSAALLAGAMDEMCEAVELVGGQLSLVHVEQRGDRFFRRAGEKGGDDVAERRATGALH